MDEQQLPVTFQHLPDEIITRVMAFLPRKDLVNLSSASRSTRQLFFLPGFWRDVSIKISREITRAEWNVLFNLLSRVGRFVRQLKLCVRGRCKYDRKVDNVLSLLPDLESLNIRFIFVGQKKKEILQ